MVACYALIRDRRKTALHLKLGRLTIHPGVVIVAIAAALDLFFAPADDLWHRLFGADVTLWGPMHLIGLTASALLAFAGLVTGWIERSLSSDKQRRQLFANVSLFFAVLLLGYLLLFLAEFEYNVPAFPMFWHPFLLASLPVFVFVLVAKLELRPWAASWTAILYTVLRLFLAAGLMLTAKYNLAGVSRPMIPVVILAAFATDIMIKRGLPLWLIGFSAGVLGLISSYPIVLLGPGNWYPQALLVGIPLGLGFAVVMAYLGQWVAAALKPAA